MRLLEHNSKRWFKVTIDDVKEIPENQYDSELRKLKQNEYVLVYNYSPQSKHTVYVAKYDTSAQVVTCMNSHGQINPYPSISLKDIVKLYRVISSAVDATLPGTSIPNF